MSRLTPRAWMGKALEAARSGFWLLPGVITLAAIIASYATIGLDRAHDGLLRESFLFEAGSDGARATLSSIASSVMTVAGISFSVTIVVLQLASSQYSPRIMRAFLRDRLIQTVLGAYIGTFTYVLLVLRTVRSDAEQRAGFVPSLSVTVAVVLGLACMTLLIAFVHHVAHSIQVSTIIDEIAGESRAAMKRLYPEEIGEPADHAPHVLPEGQGACREVLAPEDGYLDYIDERAFESIEGASLIRIGVRVGDYVRKAEVLARVWPGTIAGESCAALARAFELERERTIQQDLAFGFRMIADVAVRALSPGVNDPTTAVYCVNALSALLCEAARRRFPDSLRTLASGLVVHAPTPSFADLVHLSFKQIIHYGRGDLVVANAVVGALEAVAARDKRRRHGPVLGELAGHVAEIAATSPWPEQDRLDTVARARGLLARVAARGGEEG